MLNIKYLKGLLEVLLPRITCGLNPQAWALTHLVIRLLQIRLWKQPFPLLTSRLCTVCSIVMVGMIYFWGSKQWHSLCSASTKTRRTLDIHAIQSPTHFVLCCVKKKSFNSSGAAAVFAENMLFIIITNQKVTIVPLRVLLNRISVNMLHVLLHA